jgi:hypothetical protein
MIYRATAYNASNDTFQFRFCNANWNGIEDAARARLDEIVDGDAFHKKHGPWNFRYIDRAE